MRERGAARPPKVMAPTSLLADSGEAKTKTSARSAAGSASAPGDSAWSADMTARLNAEAAAARSAARVLNPGMAGSSEDGNAAAEAWQNENHFHGEPSVLPGCR